MFMVRRGRSRQVLLEAQYESSIDGILMVDKDCRIVSYNRRFSDIWGIPEGILATGSDQRALDFVLSRLPDPEAFLSRVKYLYSRPYLRVIDEIKLKDERVLERCSTPVFGPNKKYLGRVWSFRDVTERRRAEEARRSSEARYRELFEAESDGALVIDLESRKIEDANGAAARLFGYEKHALIGLKLERLDANPREAAAFIARGIGELAWPGSITRTMRRLTGEEFPGELTLARFTQGGRPKAIVTVRDGTERERASQAEFFKQREELQRQLVATVSHELRTPIAAIQGFAETLLGGALEDKKARAEFTRTILRHSTRLARLVDDLLALSVLEAGKRPLKREQFDGRAFLWEFAAGLEPVARRSRARLEVDAEVVLPLDADPCQLTQALQNLVDNALKHGGPGVTIKLGASPMADGGVVFEVADDGPGIPAECLPRVFEPFYRVNKAKSKGAGLGLSIVRQVAQAHGGKAWVESVPGKGTTFYLLVSAPATNPKRRPATLSSR